MPKIQSTRLFSAVLVILGVAHFARAASPPQRRGQRRLGLRDIQRLLERDRDILLP